MSFSQNPVFRNPLDLPLKLAANFGDIRPDHFHTGFDIRTKERIGFAVHAAADGYVSRIKVSGFGYGKVLYITHPNGYMTVYGHLDHFNTAIGEYVREQQYVKKSFEIELLPPKGKFHVKKGDVIAFSGNTGASGGPHLHFEVRNSSGETYPLNPARHGLAISDTLKPVFKKLKFYDLVTNAANDSAILYGIRNDSCNYLLQTDSLVTDYREIGIGTEVVDLINGNNNDYSVYKIEEALDGKNIFEVKFDRLDFSNGRYVNAHIDYTLEQQKGITIQRLFRLPGDKNDIYTHVIDNGHIKLEDTFFHQVVITASDANSNASYLLFYVRYSGRDTPPAQADSTVRTLFKFNQPNDFSADSLQLQLPANALYDDLKFHYSSSLSGVTNIYSAVHHLQNPEIPVNSSYRISILPRSMPDSLRPKAMIIYANNGRESSKTSEWLGNELTARVREFGDFYVKIDTVPPKIATVGIKQNQKIRKISIHFYISDNLSGIASYNGYLDGKWILMEYDPKFNRLNCSLPSNLPQGKHRLKLIVEDGVKNKNSFTLNFKK